MIQNKNVEKMNGQRTQEKCVNQFMLSVKEKQKTKEQQNKKDEVNNIDVKIRENVFAVRIKDYKEKLNLIDQHYYKNLPKKNVMVGSKSSIKSCSIWLQMHHPRLVHLQNPASILVSDYALSDDQKAIVIFDSSVALRVLIQMDDGHPTAYTIRHLKGVQLSLQKWNRVQIDVSKLDSLHQTLYSYVKITLTTIKLHRPLFTAKTNIDQEIQQYIENRRKLSLHCFQIPTSNNNNINTKSSNISTRHYTQKSAQSSLNQSQKQLQNKKNTSSIKKRCYSATKIKDKEPLFSPSHIYKRDLLQFQKTKTMYFKHVRKMSPDKQKIIQIQQQKYHKINRYQIFKLSNFIYLCKFFTQVKEKRAKYYKNQLKTVKVTMLCKKFIKQIKNKVKAKISYGTKMKTDVSHSINVIVSVTIATVKQKASQRIAQVFNHMNHCFWAQRIIDKANEFQKKIILIQKKFRIRKKIIKIRSEIVLNVLIVKYNKKVQKRELIIKEYVNFCLQHNKGFLGIVKNYKKMLQLIRKHET